MVRGFRIVLHIQSFYRLQKLSVTAPFCDTKFIISGDQYAQNFGLDIRKTSEYTAVAVECHLTTVVTSRKPQNGEKSNEDSYPDSEKQPISFSVPIDVQFLSKRKPPLQLISTGQFIKMTN